MSKVATITQGDRKPDAIITIGDARLDADFSSLTTETCWVVCEQDGDVLFRDHPDSVVPATDGKTAVIRRAWKADDTLSVGRLYIWVEVEWAADVPQHFPSSPLRVDVRRAPGTP
jgi:hypothetical protein